jgi:hypothetical protein
MPMFVDTLFVFGYNNCAQQLIQLHLRPWLNWIERLTTDQETAGSTPAGRAKKPPITGGFLFMIITKNNLVKIILLHDMYLIFY